MTVLPSGMARIASRGVTSFIRSSSRHHGTHDALAPLQEVKDNRKLNKRVHSTEALRSLMWLYSSGHTETRTSYSIRGVFDEPAYDEEISRRLQGTRGETGRGVGSTHCPDGARPRGERKHVAYLDWEISPC